MPLVADGPVMLTPSPNIVPDPASFVFQVGPTDPINTEIIARYMKKFGLKKIGVVAATDASGEVGVASVKSVFPAAGIPYTVIEKNSGVGGTWHENRYPGARVDTPSRSYTHLFRQM